MTGEIRHVFRLVVLGCLVFAVFAAVGISIDYYQQREIEKTQDRVQRNTVVLLRRDCNLVVSTANVFTDFIRKEIALRAIRATEKNVEEAVREFDALQVRYWMEHTLPQLSRVYAVHCKSAGGP